MQRKAFTFLEAPDSLTRGSAPGPHWGHSPQTPTTTTIPMFAISPTSTHGVWIKAWLSTDEINDCVGDRLRAGKPSRYVTSHLGQLSLLSLRGR